MCVVHSHHNPDFAADVLHLDLGFKQISVEPVVAEPSECDHRGRSSTAVWEYDKLAAEMVRRHDDFNFFQ